MCHYTTTSSSSLFGMHHQCVAPLAANSPHSGLSRSILIASSKVRLCRDRSFFRVAIQEEWGRPTGLLQSLRGTATVDRPQLFGTDQDTHCLTQSVLATSFLNLNVKDSDVWILKNFIIPLRILHQWTSSWSCTYWLKNRLLKDIECTLLMLHKKNN